MSQAQEPLFRLATYQSKDGPKVGIVIANKIMEVNRAVDFFAVKSGKTVNRSGTYSSMMAILSNWSEAFTFLAGVADYLIDNPNEFSDAQDVYNVSLLAPVPFPGKMINVGLNFHDHAREMGMTLPAEGFQPNFFLKGDHNCIVGSGQQIKLTSQFVDWEAELAVVIGKKATNVDVKEAMDHVAGYTCHNDVSDRGAMMRSDGSIDFFSGKCRDTFAPLGPFLVPKEFFPNLGDIRIQCLLNNEIMQDFGTDQMIWGPAECIAFASSRVTLQPGDVIALGTGAGTGWAKGITVGPGEMSKIIDHMFQGGGTFLKPGDRIAVKIEPIGRLENEVATS